MKWLLNNFPRVWLIKISIWFRPILKQIYKGNILTDPIDGSSYRKFLPYGYQKIRENALCPGTLSLERHRLLWLFLERETKFFEKPSKVLHIAPEQPLYKKFKQFKHWEYKTCDLNSPLAEIKADICNLPFENNSYDLVLCNHVLEHVLNDKLAIRELFRVLKKGGVLIAQVPLDLNRKMTFEDPSIIDKAERKKVFGQYDHVRIYGKDYFDLLDSAGFESHCISFTEKLSKHEIKKFSLQTDHIPLAYKN